MKILIGFAIITVVSITCSQADETARKYDTIDQFKENLMDANSTFDFRRDYLWLAAVENQERIRLFGHVL